MVTGAQLPPMLVVAAPQSVPSQQRFGFEAACGWQVRPAAHAPCESQRHPFEPAIQVVATVGGTPPSMPGVELAPPPQTLGTPPQPQHCGAVQVPHSMRLPQPSATGPQFFPSEAQVKHAPPDAVPPFVPAPTAQTLGMPPQPQHSEAAQVPH